jgi:hypothetical protein
MTGTRVMLQVLSVQDAGDSCCTVHSGGGCKCQPADCPGRTLQCGKQALSQVTIWHHRVHAHMIRAWSQSHKYERLTNVAAQHQHMCRPHLHSARTSQ